MFDRFHLSQHLSRAVDEVRRQTWRRLQGRAKIEFKQTRFLWLTNPENLAREERTRLSALLRLNSPIVKAYLLKEDLRRFWAYRSTAWAGGHLASGSGGPATAASGRSRSSRGCSAPISMASWPGPAPREQRCARGHEQQDQGDQPSRLRLPDVVDVHREHLPQLRESPTPMTLLGHEPHSSTLLPRPAEGNDTEVRLRSPFSHVVRPGQPDSVLGLVRRAPMAPDAFPGARNPSSRNVTTRSPTGGALRAWLEPWPSPRSLRWQKGGRHSRRPARTQTNWRECCVRPCQTRDRVDPGGLLDGAPHGYIQRYREDDKPSLD